MRIVVRMKKAFLLGVILAFLVISTVQAVTVTVSCNPEVIPRPGGTTTITVTCSEAASGSITVITPSGKSSALGITIPAGGGSVSKVYPTDFPSPASTAEVGEYEVIVFLSGQKFMASFWVSFNVIPQTPLGVIGAIFACFSALGIKRLKAKKK